MVSAKVMHFLIRVNNQMENKTAHHLFWKTFNQPRVIIFISIGSAVIFLTFFTNNNALEIAISAVASIFIGIGVKNYTILETRSLDKKNMDTKISHSIKVMKITRARILQMQQFLNGGSFDHNKSELEELEQIINLGMDIIKEEEGVA